MLPRILPFSTQFAAGIQCLINEKSYCKLKLTEYQPQDQAANKSLTVCDSMGFEAKKKRKRRKKNQLEISTDLPSSKRPKIDGNCKIAKAILCHLQNRPEMFKLICFWKNHGLVKNPFYPDFSFCHLHFQVNLPLIIISDFKDFGC